MELDASIEPTIGPYEVYEDEWFNYKAAFEAFITLRDDAETQKLARFGSELQEIENNLPIDPKYPQPEARRAGADPRRQHRVLVGRRQPRRADGRLQPAQRRARDRREGLQARDAEEQPGGEVREGPPADREGRARRRPTGNVSFDAFFTHILMHELMHGLGPHNISVGGRATTVRQECKETYSAIEEAKADISGLCSRCSSWSIKRSWTRPRPDDVHDLPRIDVPLDPLRHQRGARARRRDSAQLLPRQRRRHRRAGRHVHVNPERIKQNVADLTRDIMTMQARATTRGEADDRQAGLSGRRSRPCSTGSRRAGGHRAAVRHGRQLLSTANSNNQ